jgi:hypothetical protein
MKPVQLHLATFACAATSFAAVDFEKDVKPILEFNCVRCHNPKGTDFEEGKTDLDLTTRETAFETKSTIVPGNSERANSTHPPSCPTMRRK